MNQPSIITIGHVPPPVTGENLCRARLEDSLRAHGYDVVAHSRGRLWPWVTPTARAIVVVNGQSWPGTVYDLLFCTWQVLLGRDIYLYFHNRSWRRYRLWPWLWRIRPGAKVKALVLTSAIRDWLVRRGLEAVVLNNTAGPEFEELPAGTRQKRLLWMGRPDSSKGFNLALAAFQRLHEQDSGWRFDIYGSNGEGFSVQSGVIFHGFVSGKQRIEAFGKGGIFILPSSYANETQPLSIIEALAAGLPVVASGIGGIPEMIRTPLGEAGFVVRELAVNAYAAGLKACYDDYERLSCTAQRIYRAYFSHEAFKTKVAEIFGELEGVDVRTADEQQ